MLRKFQFIAIFLLALTGCSKDPVAPKLLENVSFDDYEIGDTISVPVEVETGKSLLLKIVTTETRVVVQLIDSDRIVKEKLPSPKVRLAPIYFVLEAGNKTDKFQLEIDIVARTKNSNLTVSFFELSKDSKSDQALISAYSQYSAAISSGQGSGEENTLRISQLQNSAQLFRKAKRPRLAMWSELNAAQFHLWPGSEFALALEMAEAISSQAADLGYHDIELMGRSLEGVVLTNLCSKNPFPTLLAARNEALKRYQLAFDLAQQIDMPFEKAWALNNMGISFFYLHKPTESVGHYQMALGVANDIDDAWLADTIAGNLGLAQEIRGGAAAKLEEIDHRRQEVLTQEEKGQDDQLAHALTELGRVYLQLHLFPEAVETLSRALVLLELMNNVPDSARVNMWLANAYHSMGNFDRAEILLELAIPELEKGGYCRSLIQAHSRAANLARIRGDSELVNQHREKQFSYLATDKNLADYYHDKAIDSLAETPPDSIASLRDFERATGYHSRVDSPTSAALLRVQFCSVAMQEGSRPSACSADTLLESYDLLTQQASPQTKFQGMQAWAQILSSEGHNEELEQHYKSMIDLIGFYRNKLPGVLGSWYWEARSDIFNMYLELLVEKDIEANNGVESLLALDAIRNVNLDYSRSDSSSESQDRLRSLVLDLGQINDTNEIQSTKREIELLLAQSRNIARQSQELDEFGLKDTLAGLPDTTKIVTFHFTTNGAYRWLLDNKGVRLSKVSSDGSTMKLANQVRSNLRNQGNPDLQSDLGALGEMLLGDLAGNLPDNLFLVSGGGLNGLPFDALLVGGSYIGSSTTVINMQSLAGLDVIGSMGDSSSGYRKVFAAGATNWQQLGMPDLDWVPEEIDLVRSAFPSSELTIALNEEFDQELFGGETMTGADLIHIASHADLNLEYPELSKFYLGDAQSQADFLSPLMLSNTPMKAKLVVLSACETSGSNVFSFDSNLGFVSTFLGNGADSVVATLWPVPDRESFEFMQEFYANLGNKMSTIEAYANAKKSRLQAPLRGALSSAFAYQIYIQ